MGEFTSALGRDGAPMVAVDVNRLDGIDARVLPARHPNGAAV